MSTSLLAPALLASAKVGPNIAGLPSPVVDRADLAQVANELSAISENLLASYARLARHAERVEGELVVANAELARRVAEVDALRLHLDAVRRALPCGVVVFRAGGAVASANPRALELLGTTELELTRTGGGTLLATASRVEVVHELDLPDGTHRVLAVRRADIPHSDEGGSVVIVDDRTEERRLAAELSSRSKMAALGTMAGGIAHEVRNPLNAVRGFASLLTRELDGTTRAHRFANRICQGVDEIDAIVESILGFAAPDKLARETFDAPSLVAEAVALALREDPRAAADPERWHVETHVTVPVLHADRIKVRQALRNLVANAIQAQPSGGRVVVEVSDVGTQVVLRVHDAGPGLAPHMRDRAGEPFLTTRDEGTGLGLALVHAIAAVHGGRFDIRSSGPLGGADATLRFNKTSA